MNEEKKVWFHRASSRVWLPLSWEGWALLVAQVGGVALIVWLHDWSDRQSLSLSKDWPLLLQFGALFAAFHWVSRGHVRG